jgi:hypothetical protein
MAKRKSARKRATGRRTTSAATGRKRVARKPRVAARGRKRAASRATAIDVAFKGVMAAEPPIDRSPDHLDSTFRTKLDAALADLASQGSPFKFVEGFRTVERQQWLFGSGRPTAVPFGRDGGIVTHKDGVQKLSNHQGNGTVGSGKAADCYPLRPDGRVHIPPSSDPVWQRYADAVIRQGLTAGLNFPTLRDSPHCELR